MFGLRLGSFGANRRGGLGPDLVTNGDFSGGATGWTVSGADGTHIATFSGGTLRYQSDTTSPQLNVAPTVSLGLTVGATYEIIFVISAWTSGTVKTDVISGASMSSAGTFRFVGAALINNLNITRSTTNVDVTIDSVSVRLVY